MNVKLMLAAAFIFLAIVIGGSIGRGDEPSMTVLLAVAVIIGSGVVLALALWSKKARA